ncbi:cytidylyltransferase domain-containing protein [Lysinibacillus fusiformis]|uniref:cytidylyltransferase domain-containing protein n=1 Tax=Lysinibacillus fusiformis TaxID=28031 RepID=UPI000D376F74|nr:MULTISPECIES: glycosyltransferase family protein [Lysinibacillus]MED4668288.1 glycosyltransferase family protein [Lysinibacillus fusiformis]QAS58685.1 acylneuraminate cytidylyltransferase [Lysinibacillus sphaericus]RDV35317.1 acylneuraminate cytidylyltransferase [Lysinibacillus fusiformis]GED63645.1 spore coat protein [Lysinibacillus fusiformis]
MRIVAIIQARMGSTRLPGKILKKVNGRPLLSYQLERLQQSNYINDLVIATTLNEKDDLIVEFCKKNNILWFRGSEKDVLARYYETAKTFKADAIVRITSDCPIIDVQVVDKTIQYFVDNNYEYVSNTVDRTYPRGLDTEAFTFEALEKAYKEAVMERDREHVTAYFYTNPDVFKISSVRNETDYSKYRWTVDTEEDFQLIKNIIEKLYNDNPNFTFHDTVKLMEANPDWFYINAHIEQKKL